MVNTKYQKARGIAISIYLALRKSFDFRVANNESIKIHQG